MTATSLIGLQPSGLAVSGSVVCDWIETVGLADRELARIRGRKVGFIPQDPTRSLNPTVQVGRQVIEAVRRSTDLSRAQATRRAAELLEQVQLADVPALMRRYPHQISGGQQQRVLIAMAIAGDPGMLIADEPTTALDVTVQNEILRLIVEISENRNMALLFVSHELGVVKAVCHDIGVIYGGSLVEYGTAADVLRRPSHRYTAALIATNPGLPDREGLTRMLGTRFQTIPGSIPSVGEFPVGCKFRDRCDYRTPDCAAPPPSTGFGVEGHFYRCWNPALSGEGQRGAK